LYALNKTNKQSAFFDEIRKELDNLCVVENCNIVIGGDFNVILHPDLDGNGETQNEKNRLSALKTSALLMI